MSEAQHTAGPWRHDEPTESEWWSMGANIWAGDGTVVALAVPRTSHDEARANARLIASSPKLLAELAETAQFLRDTADGLAHTHMDDVLGDLRVRADEIDATIAKATAQPTTT